MSIRARQFGRIARPRPQSIPDSTLSQAIIVARLNDVMQYAKIIPACVYSIYGCKRPREQDKAEGHWCFFSTGLGSCLRRGAMASYPVNVQQFWKYLVSSSGEPRFLESVASCSLWRIFHQIYGRVPTSMEISTITLPPVNIKTIHGTQCKPPIKPVFQ